MVIEKQYYENIRKMIDKSNDEGILWEEFKKIVENSNKEERGERLKALDFTLYHSYFFSFWVGRLFLALIRVQRVAKTWNIYGEAI